MTKSDVWSLFPVAALLGFAEWVALMVETTNVVGALVFVTLFLGAAWKACRWYHQVDEAAADEDLLLEQEPERWSE